MAQQTSQVALSISGLGRGCCLVDCFGLGPVDFSLPARRLQTWGPLLQKYVGERRALSALGLGKFGGSKPGY